MKTKRRFILGLVIVSALCLSFGIASIAVEPISASAEDALITVGGTEFDISSFETYPKASVRLDEHNGIRFVTGIDESVYNGLKAISDADNGVTVSFGTIITYKSRVEMVEDFTKAALDELVVSSGSVYVDVAALVFLSTPYEEGNKEYTAVLGVKEENYQKELTARGYMVVNDNGKESIYYANYTAFSRSAESVAKTVLGQYTDSNISTTDELDVLNDYTEKAEDGFEFSGDSAFFLPTATVSGDATISTADGIGGRDGVVAVSQVSNGKQWANRVEPVFTSPLTAWDGADGTGALSIKRQKAFGFKYMLFDFYYDGGSILIKYVDDTSRSWTQKTVKIASGVASSNEADAEDRWMDHVVIFDDSGNQTVTFTSGNWYTVLVDISENLTISNHSTPQVSIVVVGDNRTQYLDALRFYRSTDCEADIYAKYFDKEEYGGNKYYVQEENATMLEVITSNANATSSYAAYSGTVAGRTGVYALSSTASAADWNYKLAFTETNRGGTSGGAASYNYMVGKGYRYMTFDICIDNTFGTTGSGVYVYSLNSSKGHTGTQIVSGWTFNAAASYLNDSVHLYYNGVSADDGGYNSIKSNFWYTVLVEYAPGGYSSGLSSVQINRRTGTANVYFDNVRYWYNNPFTSRDSDYAESLSSAFVSTDGSGVNNPAAVITKVEDYNGRNYAYHLTTSASARMALNELNVFNSQNAYRTHLNIEYLRYQYFVFDICRAEGTQFRIYTNNTSCSVGATGNISNNTNGMLIIFDSNGEVATNIAAGEWYTIVITYAQPQSVWYTTNFADISGVNAYVSNFRYYFNDSWKTDYGYNS